MKYLKLYEELNDNILYHATNYTWDQPEFIGLGFHAGTLKAAKDRLKSFNFNINPHIKMFKFNLKNPLYIKRDYRFHNNLTKVATELYKDKIISKYEKDQFIRVYDNNATFDNLRKLLYEKYGYDGIIYRNNIEDRGSDSYIAFFPNQIEFIGNYETPIKENLTNNLKFVTTKNKFQLLLNNNIVTESGFSIENPDKYFNQKYATLYDLKTSKDFQRKGLAKYILDQIFNYVKNNLYINIIALIVYKNNPNAVNLYFNSGFEIFMEYDDSYSLIKKLT